MLWDGIGWIGMDWMRVKRKPKPSNPKQPCHESDQEYVSNNINN